MLQVTNTPASRNRKGRKRKQRITVAGKTQKNEAQVDYRAMAGEQPHRRDLPARFREDERAGTVLGNLLLSGKLGKYQNGNPSSEAQRMALAGFRYARLVGHYLTMISAPRSTAGAGRGYDCMACLVPVTKDEMKAAYETCQCFRWRKDFNNAHDELKRTVNPIFGQQVVKVVSRTAVYDEPCSDENLPLLIMGLRVLERYFEHEGRRVVL